MKAIAGPEIKLVEDDTIPVRYGILYREMCKTCGHLVWLNDEKGLGFQIHKRGRAGIPNPFYKLWRLLARDQVRLETKICLTGEYGFG